MQKSSLFFIVNSLCVCPNFQINELENELKRLRSQLARKASTIDIDDSDDDDENGANGTE